MNVKRYLQQIEKQKNIIENKNVEIQQLRDLATNISAPLCEKVQSSSSGDRVGSIASRIVDMEREQIDRIQSYIILRDNTIKIMESLELKYYSILFKVYVECKPLTIVACELGYTRRYVCDLHKEALEQFGRKYHNIS